MVAPQQASWTRRVISGTALWSRLPVELQDTIVGDANMLTLEQAKVYREELMSERTATIEIVDQERFGLQFNMWYVFHGLDLTQSAYFKV